MEAGFSQIQSHIYIYIYILDEFKKFAILKKGIGIESQNLCKQFNDQETIQTRWNLTVAIEPKVDSKAFAIPYSDCWIMKADAVKIGIANALELTFCSIATVEFHLVCIVF